MLQRAVLLSLFIVLGNQCMAPAQSEARRGALGGGAIGAVIGGIIGHQNDETAEGALIGGAVGAIAGGLLGNEKDQLNYRDYRYQQQQVIRYQQGVSMNDAIMMSQNGVSPQVIINQIQANGVQQRLGVSEIISLHQQGVSEPVINAMQNGRLATAPPVQLYQTRPVVIEHYRQPSPVIIYRSGPPCYHFDFGHGHGHRSHHDHH